MLTCKGWRWRSKGRCAACIAWRHCRHSRVAAHKPESPILSPGLRWTWAEVQLPLAAMALSPPCIPFHQHLYQSLDVRHPRSDRT